MMKFHYKNILSSPILPPNFSSKLKRLLTMKMLYNYNVLIIIVILHKKGYHLPIVDLFFRKYYKKNINELTSPCLITNAD